VKKALIIIGTVLVVCLVGAAGFWGGMKYQENQVDQARANFERERPAMSGVDFQEGGNLPQSDSQQNPQAPGFMVRGGGINGQVKSIDDNTLTISTAEDVTTVNLSDDTRIQQTLSVPVSELQPGMRVMVIGQKDEDGNVDAIQIMILDGDFSMPGNSTSPEKAP
jgi:hypothetical protein